MTTTNEANVTATFTLRPERLERLQKQAELFKFSVDMLVKAIVDEDCWCREIDGVLEESPLASLIKFPRAQGFARRGYQAELTYDVADPNSGWEVLLINQSLEDPYRWNARLYSAKTDQTLSSSGDAADEFKHDTLTQACLALHQATLGTDQKPQGQAT